MPSMSSDYIWINAGEVSGDLHGASLLHAFRELDAPYGFMGMAGPAMAAVGMEPDFNSEEIGLVGLTEVFAKLPRLALLLARTHRLLKERRPRAVIVIDCPDYNFLVARMAHGLGIPVYYYISPQVWAWRRGRVKFLKKFIQAVLCILPFEERFLRERGVRAEFVGHPVLDEMPLDDLLAIQPETGLVGLLPGSRRKEIEALTPEMGQAALRLQSSLPRLRFALFPAPGVDAAALRSLLPSNLDFEIIPPQERYLGMRRCQALIAASGTVTLEAALLGTPTVVAYRLSRLTFALARRVVKVPFISLPNLIMNSRVFPELLQDWATGECMADEALHWLADESAETATRNELAALRRLMGPPGAPLRAARFILNDLARQNPANP